MPGKYYSALTAALAQFPFSSCHSCSSWDETRRSQSHFFLDSKLNLSVCLSVCLSVSPSVRPSVRLSVCKFLCVCSSSFALCLFFYLIVYVSLLASVPMYVCFMPAVEFATLKCVSLSLSVFVS